MRHLRSQAGSTIILVLGAAAIVGAIMMEIYRRNELAIHRGEQLALRGIVDVISQSISARTEHPTFCANAFAGQVLTPGQVATLTTNQVRANFILDPAMNNPAGNLGMGSQVTTGVYIRSFGIDVAARPDFATRILGPAGDIVLNRYPATLSAVYSNVAPASNDKPVFYINKTGALGRDLFVWLEAGTNRLHSCFGPNSSGAMCNEAGGYFIEPVPTALNPVPDYRFACRYSMYTVKDPLGANIRIGSIRVGGISYTRAGCQGASAPMGYNWPIVTTPAARATPYLLFQRGTVNFSPRTFRMRQPLVNQLRLIQPH